MIMEILKGLCECSILLLWSLVQLWSNSGPRTEGQVKTLVRSGPPPYRGDQRPEFRPNRRPEKYNKDRSFVRNEKMSCFWSNLPLLF